MGSPSIGAEEIKEVVHTLESGWITQGPKTKQFENALAEFTGASKCVAMNNGTSTLHAILLAYGIGNGDEIIVPNLTYLSSVSTILMVGATPVLVDCDTTFNAPPELIEKAITPKTKAIMAVDMKGMPIDYDGYKQIANAFGLQIIADSAEALGAEYKGIPIGCVNDIHSFSFFANKNITSGEGGAVTLNNLETFEKLCSIRNQGQDKERYIHNRLGNNFRFNDISASIGMAQLRKIDTIIQRKNEIAEFYFSELKGIEGCSPPQIPSYVTKHSWYNFCLLFKNQTTCTTVEEAMRTADIETRKSFPPMHSQPFMKDMKFKISGSTTNAVDLYSRMLDIPSHSNLSQQDIEKVVTIIKKSIND